MSAGVSLVNPAAPQTRDHILLAEARSRGLPLRIRTATSAGARAGRDTTY
jgi:hypothetical protein